MTMADLKRRALALPIHEQLELAQALWENAASPVQTPVDLVKHLEARRAEALADPEAGSTWEDVRARLREAGSRR